MTGAWTGAWVWIPMPEKHYYAYVETRKLSNDRIQYDISMVDPIPNRPVDECYGEAGSSDSIRVIDEFVDAMLADRKRYFGDRNWRPDRSWLSHLWKIRKRRLHAIREHIAEQEILPPSR